MRNNSCPPQNTKYATHQESTALPTKSIVIAISGSSLTLSWLKVKIMIPKPKITLIDDAIVYTP